MDVTNHTPYTATTAESSNKNIIKMVLKTQNNAVAGHGQGATIAHLLALNPTTSGNHKIWQETNHFQKSQDCHTYMHIFQSLSHLRLSNCFFVPQSCSAKWSSRAEARCVREAWTLRLFPILLPRTQTPLTSHHPQPLQQGGKVKSLMISPALVPIPLLLLIHLKLVDRIAL